MKTPTKLDEYLDKPKDDTTNDAIWVNGFQEADAKNFNTAVLKIANLDSNKPILVFIDSYGGAVDALASMLSVLDTIPNKLITVATGKAMSCGAMLLSHGDLRYVAPHARVMIHEVSAGAQGNVNDIKNSIQETDRLNEYYMDILASNMGLKSRKDLITRFFTNERRDYYMDAKTAVKFKIADRIGIPRLKKVSRYEVVIDE